VQTPRLCGQECKAGDFVLEVTFFRPNRTSWLIVGIRQKLLKNLVLSDLKIRGQRQIPGCVKGTIQDRLHGLFRKIKGWISKLAKYEKKVKGGEHFFNKFMGIGKWVTVTNPTYSVGISLIPL